ncbi:MAG: DUF1799 domain-containing protein [Nitrosomonas sp.]|nr:DUF1799 domain-containing protein [Nitrosomonas sp.]
MEDDEAESDEYFAVFSENWKTVRIFLSLSNCWAVDGMSGRFSGIHRTDIQGTLVMFNVRPCKRRAILHDLIAMESAALEVLNRK